jgi:hypothetical protein
MRSASEQVPQDLQKRKVYDRVRKSQDPVNCCLYQREIQYFYNKMVDSVSGVRLIFTSCTGT